jgi:hypothetical protein
MEYGRSHPAWAEPRSLGRGDKTVASRPSGEQPPDRAPAGPSGAREKETAMNSAKQRCYFCGRPVVRATSQRLAVCGQCPDSAAWQAIWRQQRREP